MNVEQITKKKCARRGKKRATGEKGEDVTIRGGTLVRDLKLPTNKQKTSRLPDAGRLSGWITGFF